MPVIHDAQHQSPGVGRYYWSAVITELINYTCAFPAITHELSAVIKGLFSLSSFP